MRKSMLALALVVVLGIIMFPMEAKSQMGPGSGYGMGPGMMGGWVDVPAKLPTPNNAEWVQKLREILTLEKQSLAQYQTDQEKFNAYMPYMMVIPQEENHIEWIGQLFEAYGLPADGKVDPVVENKTLTEAYELSAKMESDLLPRYEWLVKKAEDRDTAQVLNAILIQSRWHLVMFEHAVRMGHGYGYSRGSGMMGGYGSGMGQGMMGPGYGRGPGMMGPGYGYGPRYQQPRKPLEEKDAKEIVETYVQSTRNPNLKVGNIEDKGSVFEVEIQTKDGSLVDRITVDKHTGWMRSIY